jgi:protein CpxP
MRIFSPSLTLGAILVVGLSGGTLLAQDQSQPAASATQALAGSQSPSSDMQPRHAQNPNREAKRMAKNLGLTPNQQAKIERILADRQEQVQSAPADTTLARKDKRAKVQGINPKIAMGRSTRS